MRRIGTGVVSAEDDEVFLAAVLTPTTPHLIRLPLRSPEDTIRAFDANLKRLRALARLKLHSPLPTHAKGMEVLNVMQTQYEQCLGSTDDVLWLTSPSRGGKTGAAPALRDLYKSTVQALRARDTKHGIKALRQLSSGRMLR